MSYSFHPGERAVQERMRQTTKADHVGRGGHDHIPAVAADFLREQSLLAISARDPHGVLWVSPLAGPAGFADLIDDRTVIIRAPLPQADPLSGAFDVPADCGLIALDPARRRRMRVNGTATRRGDDLTIQVDMAFANCPKHIQRRERRIAPPAGEPAVSARSASLAPHQQAMIERADTFFMGTHVPGRGADCSHRGGNPGFVRVDDAQRLHWPDYPGNAMYATLGNLELDPAAALLFLDWEHGHALQLTGQATLTTEHRPSIEFTVAATVETAHRLPHSWKLLDYSPANPAEPPSRPIST